ncbi:phage Gp37/Gp68 family protein [Paraburkholderia adhaesiva]|uniref:phage Gp37/Gp68 family protein n=1 Tax=Paraburkholderia adhaesiva TaxID=2883244 RepID=UPI001F275B02|nr:phage Gp37/Gp68 family protein [Paraburkholderia adhaesiva]
MSEQSSIEWCDATFNPWIGCTKISPACDHCYAECSTPARTLRVQWGAKAERHRTSSVNWRQPIRWNAQHEAFHAQHGHRRRVFCASLADVFDNHVPDDWRADLFDLVAATPNLDWLILTKRIGNVAAMLPYDWTCRRRGWPANVWLGITVVNQGEADRDIPKLLAVPARVRFLSMEPLLGPVSLNADWLSPAPFYCDERDAGIDWVIVGGESGPGARPMGARWVRELRDQCARTHVPFLFKQWGEWAPARMHSSGDPGRFAYGDYDFDPVALHEVYGYPRQFTMFGARAVLERVGKKAAGRLLDGREHNNFPADWS